MAFLETGEMRWLGIGVVNEGYNTTAMPGWYDGSVGYHTDDGRIFHNTGNDGRETKGRMARRGDRIRCTVIFDNERKSDGKVQVVFFLNDKKIMMRDGEDHIFMDYDQPLYPYIGLTHGCSVLAKMFSNKNEACEVSKLEDLDRKLEEKSQNLDRKLEEKSQNLDRKIEETNKKLDILLARLALKTTTTAETQTEFS